MTKIKFKKKDSQILFLSLTDHAGYGESGEDIVCAALSVLSQAMIIGIEEVLKFNLKYELRDGFLEIDLSKNTPEEVESCQVLLETMLKTVESMIISYGDYINLEIEEV